MNFSKILKTKTIKVNNPIFNKVRVKIKFAEIDFEFLKDNDYVKGLIGITYCLGLDYDNTPLIKSILINDYKVNSEDANTIIDYLSCYIKLNTK